MSRMLSDPGFEVPLRGELLIQMALFVKVYPWKRPGQRTHGGRYQPKQNRVELMNELTLYDRLDISVPVIVDSFIFFSKPGPSQRFPTGKRFGDEDNLRKTINDCLVETGIIKDDSLVLGGENYKAFSNEDFAIVKIFEVKGAT